MKKSLRIFNDFCNYYTMSKNACLQGHFCEAVNDAECAKHISGKAAKNCVAKFLCAYYNTFSFHGYSDIFHFSVT